MFDMFKEKPSTRINRYLLIAGIVIFIPCYTFILQLFKEMGIDTTEFNTVWLSFDPGAFRNFFQKLDQGGHLSSFSWSFQMNIISMTGFMLLFFALTLMLARRVPVESRLYKTAFVFPLLPIIIGVADILPSLLLIAASGDLLHLAEWKIFTISGGYVFRVLLLYLLIIWMLIAGFGLLYKKWQATKS